MADVLAALCGGLIFGGIFPLGASLLNSRVEHKRNGYFGAAVFLGISIVGQLMSLDGERALMTLLGFLLALIFYVFCSLRFPPQGPPPPSSWVVGLFTFSVLGLVVLGLWSRSVSPEVGLSKLSLGGVAFGTKHQQLVELGDWEKVSPQRISQPQLFSASFNETGKMTNLFGEGLEYDGRPLLPRAVTRAQVLKALGSPTRDLPSKFYSLYLLDDDGVHYILEVSDLSEGRGEPATLGLSLAEGKLGSYEPLDLSKFGISGP